MKIFLLLAFFSIPALSFTVIGPGAQGWDVSPLTFYVNDKGCPMSPAALDDLVNEALSVWNTVGGSSLKVEKSSTRSTATVEQLIKGKAKQVPVILCDPEIQKNSGGADPNRIPAYTRPGDKFPLRYGGVVLNAVPNSRANLSSFDRDTQVLILAHEIGHVLGLGHTDDPQALMYYSIGNKTKAILSEDDKVGVSFLYPRNEFVAGPFGCGAFVHGASGRVTHIALSVALMLLWLGSLLCVGRCFHRPRRELN